MPRDGIVYVLETGPRGGGNIAVRAGGEGDVSKTHIVWRGTERSRIVTPVLEDNRIYFVNGRAANCLDAASGKSIYRVSLTGGPVAAEPSPGGRGREDLAPADRGPDRQATARRTRPGGGGGRGGMGREYSSPVLADGKIYFLSRSGRCVCL